MKLTRATGRNAAVIKYDLLTALGAMGCGGDKHLQRLVLRLITLIVARYNWGADDLTVGQREIATLWAVDERTVKREMAKLRDLGWLVVRRPAARGRVASYGLDIPAILSATAGAWTRVGPDFQARMSGREATDAAAAPQGNVISFPLAPQGEGVWPRLQARLLAENPPLYSAWFAALDVEPGSGERLVLRAPTRFHATFVNTHHLARLTRMAAAIDPQIRTVEVVS